MRDDLMPEEIEVDPLFGAATLGTTENRAVKSSRCFEVVDREGDVERTQ